MQHHDATIIAMAQAGFTSEQIGALVGMSGGGLRKHLTELRRRGEIPEARRQVGEVRYRFAPCDDDEPIRTIWELSPLHQRTLRRLKPEWFL